MLNADGTFTVDAATDSFGFVHPGPHRLVVHLDGKCWGEHCVIHKPSQHHMQTWPLVWREDRKMMERTCPHGTGHPDPDEVNPDTSHGCDGCCASREEI